MRQVVVLEPAGSVLVIRQTSLAGGNGSGGVAGGAGGGGGVTGVTTTNNSVQPGSNHHNAHETHAALTNNAVSTALASSDHNQNRIVVVRSSSSTCMTSSADNSIIVNGNGNVNNNATIGVNGNVVVNAKSNQLGLSADICAGNPTSKQSERNDHLRSDYKCLEKLSGGITSDSISSGNRQKSIKENVHESIGVDIKTDASDMCVLTLCLGNLCRLV